MKKSRFSQKKLGFIRDDFGPQLEHEQRIEDLQIGNPEEVVTICYCLIGENRSNPKQETIVLLPGFGSGWTGMAMLSYYLVQLGYAVCMISLPGYGNSSSPGQFYHSSAIGFYWYARTLEIFAKKIFPNKKLHWVGHSMGSIIISHLAQKHPEHVKSLTLLNPVGFRKRNPLGLMVKFVYNGLLHRIAFSGNETWAELSRHLPVQKSPFAKERKSQRIDEFELLCAGSGLLYLQNIDPNIPVGYITAEYDFVETDAHKTRERYHEFQKAHPEISWFSISGLFHNTTMYGSDKTADSINLFIEKTQRES